MQEKFFCDGTHRVDFNISLLNTHIDHLGHVFLDDIKVQAAVASLHDVVPELLGHFGPDLVTA